MKKLDLGDPSDVRARLHRLGLYGLLTRWSELSSEPWIARLLDIEESERKKRSLDRRIKNARIGAFKPIDTFDWRWPTKIDREAIEDLFTLSFMDGTCQRV